MINKIIQDSLNKQVLAEGASSHLYLAMASWADTKGYQGVANFFYSQSDEERLHMMKLVKYINERGGHAHIPAIKEPLKIFDCLTHVFQDFLNHEVKVSGLINDLVHTCLENKDYTTHNFMQWYVAEQIEEEAMARTILDKLKLIGDDKGGLYLFDRDINQLNPTVSVE